MFVKSVRSQTDFLRFENRYCKVWKWYAKGSRGLRSALSVLVWFMKPLI